MNKDKLKDIDFFAMIIPLIIVLTLCLLFIFYPAQSANITNIARSFLGNQLGFFYTLMGISFVAISLYIAFSKYGKIKLGNIDKPEFSNFSWGAMIFTATMAADILFYSFIEWALYANELRVAQLGSVQDWASTFPLFHWGPIPWSFYIVLAVAFGFMLHVRGRDKQKFSEACRPLLGNKVDGVVGKIIDLIAVFALLAGTATTFSLATPLLSQALSEVFGLNNSISLTLGVLIVIACVYTITVLFGLKGVKFLANFCTVLFFTLLAFFLFAGGEAIYIIETGITSIGNLVQNFIGLSTWMDPLRTSGDGTSGFVQNWTIFYWAYWMVWCVATPFFVGSISKGRSIKNVVLGGYGAGLAGTFISFIILGNYGLSQQMRGTIDVLGLLTVEENLSLAIIEIFKTLPGYKIALLLLCATMVIFYSTTFDSLTLVISSYSYKRLSPNQSPHKLVKIFWATTFIVLPIGLIFSQSTLNSLQSVSIVAAFPIGIVMIIIVASFFKDANIYLKNNDKNKN